MAQRRISMSEITIGNPLPWDVYDENGHLLLRKGYMVGSVRQVESLVERGLFAETGASQGSGQQGAPVEKPQETPSVLRLINQANKRLERLLFSLPNESDAQAKILEVAKVLHFAIELNPDIALACILLNQISGVYAVRHCVDTAIVAILVARDMKKSTDEILTVTAAALTMNIGMLRYHDQLQGKAEGLTRDEVDNIRKHPQQSVEMLQQAEINDPDWLSYVLHHHENGDGSGYPFGKTCDDIPQNAKIIALADRYCARVSARSYRQSLLPNLALRDLFLEKGKCADPMLAAYFIKELGIYPPGTFVRLQNGEIGVVTRKGQNATTPIVHALIGPRGAPLSFPIKRETDKELHAIREALREDEAAIRFRMQQLWGDEASL